MDWYVLFVQTGKEVCTKEWIERYILVSNGKCIVPKRRLSERRQGKVYKVERLLFPGYVFVNTDVLSLYISKIIEIPYIIKLLGRDGDRYLSVPKGEIEPILKLIGDGQIIDYSKLFIENAKVRVISGPLMGMEASIVKVDKRRGRAKVFFNIAGSVKFVDLGVEVLRVIS